MTVAELATVAGIVLGIAALIAGIIVRDRQVHKTIDDKVGEVDKRVDTVDDKHDREAKLLHERINRVRDEMVRPSDLTAFSTSMESGLRDVRDQLKILTGHLLKGRESK